MKKIILIIPFFGQKPEYYDVWAQCAKNNETIDFLILSDIDEIKSDRNIIVKHMQFSDLSLMIQDRFDFCISLISPYKLCDFKPAYGYIFSDEIREYDFWGHCDIDLIFGDIRKFVTEEICNQYDKIYEHGHFCLYRNNEKCRKLFTENGEYPEINYEEAFSSEDSWGFDEFAGMMLKCHRLGVNNYCNISDFFDAKVQTKRFVHALEKKQDGYSIIKYSDKRLYRLDYDNNRNFEGEKEIMYFHFQKRSLQDCNVVVGEHDTFWIKPNRFVLEELENWIPPTQMESWLYQKRSSLTTKIKKLRQHIHRYLNEIKNNDDSSLLTYLKARKQMQNRYKDIERKLSESE